MKYITQSEWDKTPKDYKTIKPDGTRQKLFMVPDQGTTLETVTVLLDKQKFHAFKKDVYLLGEDENGTRYFLEAASWDCGWYWGFGYIESYTNNKRPDLARDIESHEHADKFMSEWFTEWNGSKPRLSRTTFTEKEGWELSELLKQYYILRESAELFHNGGAHVTTSEVTHKREDLAKEINEQMLPKVFERIYQILEPSAEV